SEDAGRSQAVDPRHLDVEERDVRMVRPGRCDYLVAAPDGCHDLEVLLQRQHDGQRAPDELLVIGQQQADHHALPSGESETRNRHPVGSCGPASTTPPAAATRSRNPDRPFPGGAVPPTPSSTISTEDAESRMAQE